MLANSLIKTKSGDDGRCKTVVKTDSVSGAKQINWKCLQVGTFIVPIVAGYRNDRNSAAEPSASYYRHYCLSVAGKERKGFEMR